MLVLGESEVQYADGVYVVEFIVPAAPLRLLSDGECGIVDGAVFIEILVYILHLHDDARASIRCAVYVKDSAAGFLVRTELLAVFIGDVRDDRITIEQRIEETHQQILVEGCAKDALETEVGQWIDVSFSRVYHGVMFFVTKIGLFVDNCKLSTVLFFPMLQHFSIFHFALLESYAIFANVNGVLYKPRFTFKEKRYPHTKNRLTFQSS